MLGRNINFIHLQYFGFEEIFSCIGWLSIVIIFELIFSTLIQIFYSRMTYCVKGPIASIVKGIEIQVDLESIYLIFYVA